MAVYASYHRNPLNRLTHFFGVPLIMFSLFVPLSWVDVSLFGLPVNGAMLLVAATVCYYCLLDVSLAVACAVLSVFLLMAAYYVAASFSPAIGWVVFAAGFIGGWILQIVGHVFEGRRPALLDNVWQIFVAPIFLVAEGFFALGLKRDIRDRIRARRTE
jgi:uncharacterized membrane protein YGL010W